MNVHELPDGDDILSILKDESAKLHVWITAAVSEKTIVNLLGRDFYNLRLTQ